MKWNEGRNSNMKTVKQQRQKMARANFFDAIGATSQPCKVEPLTPGPSEVLPATSSSHEIFGHFWPSVWPCSCSSFEFRNGTKGSVYTKKKRSNTSICRVWYGVDHWPSRQDVWAWACNCSAFSVPKRVREHSRAYRQTKAFETAWWSPNSHLFLNKTMTYVCVYPLDICLRKAWTVWAPRAGAGKRGWFTGEEPCGDQYRIEHAGRWLDQRVAILADEHFYSDELQQPSSLPVSRNLQLATALTAERARLL